MRLNRSNHLAFLSECEKRSGLSTLGRGPATSNTGNGKSKQDVKGDRARRSYVSLMSSVSNAEDEVDTSIDHTGPANATACSVPLLPIPLVRTKLVEVRQLVEVTLFVLLCILPC